MKCISYLTGCVHDRRRAGFQVVCPYWLKVCFWSKLWICLSAGLVYKMHFLLDLLHARQEEGLIPGSVRILA